MWHELKNSWQPGAGLSAIEERARLYSYIREFFLKRQVLEVETPLCMPCAITDVAIAPVACLDGYLQTSPEYAMKRLLCAYPQHSIYQICKAFRAQEQGAKHSIEFTMLEWYRLGWDDKLLMQEVATLVATYLNIATINYYSYQQLFTDFFAINPHQVTTDILVEVAKRYKLEVVASHRLTKDDWLALLLERFIEPTFAANTLNFIYDYPASQAALAKVVSNGEYKVAKRFELYIGNLELGNGYWELTDASEQAKRFSNDNAQRRQLGLRELPVDQKLLEALEHGLPECAGMALGLDRLLMCKLGLTNIADTLTFTS